MCSHVNNFDINFISTTHNVVNWSEFTFLWFLQTFPLNSWHQLFYNILYQWFVHLAQLALQI